MRMNGINERANLHVTVSYLVTARSRAHALETANANVNPGTALLNQIKLVNEQAHPAVFTVEGMHDMQWTIASAAEYTGRFKVTGHMTLALRARAGSGTEPPLIGHISYRLPQSIVQERPILVIPTWNEPVFTHVLSQRLEWVSERTEVAAFELVG